MRESLVCLDSSLTYFPYKQGEKNMCLYPNEVMAFSVKESPSKPTLSYLLSLSFSTVCKAKNS